MTNVVPLRQPSSRAGPFEAMRDLQALYARLIEITEATRSMAHRLELEHPESNATGSLAEAAGHLTEAADLVLNAIADSIVRQTAIIVIPAAPNSNMPDSSMP